MSDEPELELSKEDKNRIALEGALMAVPYVGSSLVHFITGPLIERRFKRIENTLHEVTTGLGDVKSLAAVNENFANLLETVIPDLSRAVEDEKRQRFRDLLSNAVELPEGSTEWEEAALAAALLRDIGTPGLAILAALSKLDDGETATLTSSPVSQLVRGAFDYDNPGEPQQVIPYQWPVVEYWARWLRENRLIRYASHDARGGFGDVAVAELGTFLLRWVLR